MLPNNHAEVAEPNIIHRVEVGSTIHGCSLEGTDDIDHMGVCLEPPHYVVGLGHFEQWEHRDAVVRMRRELELHPELRDTLYKNVKNPRSMPGDLDLVVYSLRKWCRLALKGNPTALMLLFSPKIIKTTPVGQQLQQLAPAFASQRAGRAFLGYMRAQREQLQNRKGGKDVTREELIKKYGFDTKFAYHMLRLGYQGIEYLNTGRIELPIKADVREHLIDVRTGKVSEGAVISESSDLEAQLEKLLALTSVPEEPATEVVDQFVMDAYQDHWGWYPDVNAKLGVVS